MQGVVPAAGEGTRLRPLTEDRPKALVPVAGRPLLAYALETLVQLGADELIVVIGYEGEQIKSAFGGAFAGIPVRYAYQEAPTGLAKAVLAAEDVIDDDFMVLNGDNVVRGPLSYVVEEHRAAAADATLVVDVVSRSQATSSGVVTFDADGRPTGVIEKPTDPPTSYVARGFFVFSPRIFDACRHLEPGPTGEYELTAAIDRLIQRGATVKAVQFEGECVNVNTSKDLEAAERLLKG